MRIPTSTYRIQLNPSFGLRGLKKILPYLAELGISDIYVSPIFRAREGSEHGYDVVDPNQLNPELGDQSDMDEIAEDLRQHQMGWVQDIVPNHMAFDFHNQMLVDVLENGPHSQFFDFFDIQWDHPYESLKGRVLAPFLGKFYGEALEDGDIALTYDSQGFAVVYYHWRFPLRMESYIALLTHQMGPLKRKLGRNHPDYIKLLGILYVLKTLSSEEDRSERYDQIHFVKAMLFELYSNNENIRQFIEKNIQIFNGQKGEPGSFNLLDSLLIDQFFRLSFWKVATEEINYRRFFNINELICLKVENKDVLLHTHAWLFRLLNEGKITGLRIDHIDGLHHPHEYLQALRKWAGDVFVVVEKILDLDESLSISWPVQGTTGYDFVNQVNGLFCRQRNEKAMTTTYAKFTGIKISCSQLVSDKKRLIIGKHMAGDVDNLAHLLHRISSKYRYGSDITLYGLRRGLVELLAHLPVYRTYVHKALPSDTDMKYIRQAVERAVENNPELLHELHLIERFLTMNLEDYLSDEEKDQCLHFVMRFQQFSGPLMAKGFEDTSLYVYNRLLSLNEVGGNPGRFGISVEDFHQFNQRQAADWLHKLNTTSTHDTKRGEDVRARINVLSELPKEWEEHLKTWSRLTRSFKRRIKGLSAPDRNDEYFFYQTLIGAYPFSNGRNPDFLDRMKAYLIKAVREAKVHTAWLKPDSEYEDAFMTFVEKALGSPEGQPFLQDFEVFQRKISRYGILNSLSQTLIKITSPGVPDLYQGTELWDLNLVDPDNRRPVDFEKRQEYLREIRAKSRSDLFGLVQELLEHKEDGRIKLFLIRRLLQGRTGRRELFQQGEYIPLYTAGAYRENLVAFARRHGKRWAVTIAPRFLTGIVNEETIPVGAIWHDTQVLLPKGAPRTWRDVITDQTIETENAIQSAEALSHFPSALLFGEVLP